MQYKMGQKVWLQYHQNYGTPGIELEVTKVGHIWVEFNKGRFRVHQGSTDVIGTRSIRPGRIYNSEAEVLSDKFSEAYKAWNTFLKLVTSKRLPPVGVSVDHINSASELLRLHSTD
jgi:hypothetical protein